MDEPPSAGPSNPNGSIPYRVSDPKKQTLREELNELAIESFINAGDDVVNFILINPSKDLQAIADMKAEDRPQLKDASKVRALMEQAHDCIRAAALEVQAQLEPSGVFEAIRAKRKLEEERAPKRKLLERIVNNQYRITFSDQVEDFNARLRDILKLQRGPMRYSMDIHGMNDDDGKMIDMLDLAHLQQIAPSDEELTMAWRAQVEQMHAKRAKKQ